MKKVCFIKFEGILQNDKEYSADPKKVKKFLEELTSFSKEKDIELFLVSGLHSEVVEKQFENNVVKDFFDKDHFFYVGEKYISSKKEVDEKIHRDNLEKDPNFNDSYFKQIIINKILEEKKLSVGDALLLCNDVWVDGYYTMKFSKIDFAIFNDNILERGNKIDKINGLVYFDLDFNAVKDLLEDFPIVDLSSLDKFVFEKMKEVLLKDVDFSKLVKKAAEGKNNVS